MTLDRRTFLAGAALLPAAAAAAENTDSGIGAKLAPEASTFRDPGTGRTIRRLTSAKANSYPLYYFTPSHTLDGRYLIFHSERSGWVELYRMDLESGESVQLTAGRTRDSGWAVWCEWRLRGIYNHLSALNQVRREVYYFQDEELRSTHVDTLANRRVYNMPGRISIGQSSFSPDGRYYAFIHADRRNFVEVMSDREALANMKLGGTFDWRNRIPATIGLIETETGKYSDIIQLDFHVHHVIFADNRRVLVNHIKDGHGMWMIGIDGSGRRTLRPPDEHGSVVHQVVTRNGIYYEAVGDKAKSGAHNWFGRYDLASDTFEEIPLPEIDGYVHTGLDPGGRFLFFEEHGSIHRLMSLHFPRIAGKRQLKTLRQMARYPGTGGQRYHAHPFLAPDRKSLFYTEPINGYSQICAMDVRDLAGLDEYWDRRA
jgi:hypothetical protein